MIPVILDSNILNHRRKGFPALENLAKSDLIRVHIPYIVKRELETQREASCNSEFNKILEGIDRISELASDDHKEALRQQRAAVQAMIAPTIERYRSSFTDWTTRTKAMVHDLTPEHTLSVLDAYFKGDPPFKAMKVREDIPDAFIYEDVKKIIGGEQTVAVITADKGLIKALGKLEKAIVFNTVDEFLKWDLIIKAQAKELERQKETERIEKLTRTLKADSSTEDILTRFVNENIGDRILWSKISLEDSWDTAGDHTITSYSHAKETKILSDALTYYGRNSFSVPFSVVLKVTITYYIYKADYWLWDEHEQKPSLTDHNDHVFEAEDEREVQICGGLQFKVYERANDDDEADLTDEASVEIEYISSIEEVD